MLSDRAFVCHMCIPCDKTEVKIIRQGQILRPHFSLKMAVTSALVFHKPIVSYTHLKDSFMLQRAGGQNDVYPRYFFSFVSPIHFIRKLDFVLFKIMAFQMGKISV